METLWQDLRYGFRMLARNPGFTTVAVLTLALGIGANASIFSVVNAVLLHPLPYKEPDRLVAVFEENPEKGLWKNLTSPPTFWDWKRQNQVFSYISLVSQKSFFLTGEGKPSRIRGFGVSSDFFSLLRVPMLMGRGFQPGEDQAGNDDVVVLSHGFWQSQFGGDSRIIGRRIRLDDRKHTVIGVLPEDFWFAVPSNVWVPLAFGPDRMAEGMRFGRYLGVMARIKPGLTIQQAQDGMEALATRLGEQHPYMAGWTVKLVPAHEQLVGSSRSALLILLGAVGFVLLIACTNVANLLLARTSSRQKELAVRAALGASQLRLVRQLLTETILLFSAGGALGLLLAFWSMEGLVGMAPRKIPRLDTVQLDAQVFAFATGISLFTGLIFGLIPALRTSNPHLQEALKEAGRGGSDGKSSSRLRSFLVVSEIALSLVLLIGAGLLTRSFLEVQSVPPGFNPDGITSMTFSLPTFRYQRTSQQAEFFRQVIKRWQALPGVKQVGASTNLPLSGYSMHFDVTVPGGVPASPDEQLRVQYHATTPNYFRTMGIPLLQGRDFSGDDDANSRPITIINDTMARRFWPGQNPVGKLLEVGSRLGGMIEREIVGVTGDVRHFGLNTDPLSEIYVPYAQDPWHFITIVVRSSSDPSTVTPLLREAVWAVDPDMPLGAVTTLNRLMYRSTQPFRFQMALMAMFALLALTMAAVGLYSVISYSVSRRTHEIGIRMALGAQPRDILKLVVGQGMVLTLIGVGVGLAASFALTRFLESLLFGVSATDPATFAGVALLLAAVALLACYIPARRATRVDPLVALRYE